MDLPADLPVPVGVLGATGLVGQRIVERVARHPWFKLAEVGASDASAGERLGQRLDLDPSAGTEVASLVLRPLSGPWSSPLILSALPSDTAREVEPRLAEEGHLVVSNASAFRAEPTVPLVIPEVNPDHLSILRPGEGAIVTNPNCAAIPLAMALAPLHRAFGVESVVVTTLQAVSGAGRPGPGSIELLDNVLPQIAGEEEKLEREPQKLLGRVEGGRIRSAPFTVSASTTRVPVLHGHLLSVSVKFASAPTPEEALQLLAEDPGALGTEGFGRLPSLPPRPLRILSDPFRPQPRLDRDHDGGMAVSVGRVRPCPVLDLRMILLAHNLERGAAGAAVSNAELCLVKGLVPR